MNARCRSAVRAVNVNVELPTVRPPRALGSAERTSTYVLMVSIYNTDAAYNQRWYISRIMMNSDCNTVSNASFNSIIIIIT